jgi:hypothetical protein
MMSSIEEYVDTIPPTNPTTIMKAQEMIVKMLIFLYFCEWRCNHIVMFLVLPTLYILLTFEVSLGDFAESNVGRRSEGT